MTEIARDPETNGCVEFEDQAGGILLVRYSGDISMGFVEQSADVIVKKIEAGLRRVLYDVEHSTPRFSPVDLLDEVRRIGRAGGKRARFAYLAPPNMFTKHFMLIEAAAFNEGIAVKFFSDDDEARAWLKNGI